MFSVLTESTFQWRRYFRKLSVFFKCSKNNIFIVVGKKMAIKCDERTYDNDFHFWRWFQLNTPPKKCLRKKWLKWSYDESSLLPPSYMLFNHKEKHPFCFTEKQFTSTNPFCSISFFPLVCSVINLTNILWAAFALISFCQ